MSKISKYLFICIFVMISLCSCDRIKYGELFEITDGFVDNLHSSYRSYGLFGGLEYAKHTKDKEYRVFPIGRLINVRIEHYADGDEYESLRKALESHYADNRKVNQVYRNRAGTITIDCRY